MSASGSEGPAIDTLRRTFCSRLEDDVEKHVARLRRLGERGEIRVGYSEPWYVMFEEALIGLRTLAERHPYAPERHAWGRDVRNALFADYRILYLVVEEQVWAMHVRAPTSGSAQAPRSGDGIRATALTRETWVWPRTRFEAWTICEKTRTPLRTSFAGIYFRRSPHAAAVRSRPTQ